MDAAATVGLLDWKRRVFGCTRPRATRSSSATPAWSRAASCLFDDYGSGMQSPGAARAIDDFMAGRPEPLIDAPSAQAFLIKR